MQSQQERLMGELATDIAELADDLPSWMDDPPEADLQTFTALQDHHFDQFIKLFCNLFYLLISSTGGQGQTRECFIVGVPGHRRKSAPPRPEYP